MNSLTNLKPLAPPDRGEGADVTFVSLLLRAAARMEHGLNVALVDWGLNLTHYRVLGAIVRDGISTPSQCARQLRLSPSNVTRAVDHLYAKKWVDRARAADDRRAVSLYATASGMALLAKARRQVDAVLARHVPSFNAEGQRMLLAAMSRMAADDAS